MALKMTAQDVISITHVDYTLIPLRKKEPEGVNAN